MPYTTERGVTSYRDNWTAPEYATGADEERAAYNNAQDAAYAAAESLYGLLDNLYDPPADVIDGRAALEAMAAKLNDMGNECRRLLGTLAP